MSSHRKLFSILDKIPSTLTLDAPSAAAAAIDDVLEAVTASDGSRNLLATTPRIGLTAAQRFAARTCSTNANPRQTCPAGWDKVTKAFTTTPASATTPAVAAASLGKAGKQRKGPSRIPGTVSALWGGSDKTPTVSAKTASSAATAAAADSGAYCSGAALYRPVTIDEAIEIPFDAVIDPETGDWMFHAGITFNAAADTDIYAAHDGIITATGTDPTLGDFVVSDVVLSCAVLWLAVLGRNRAALCCIHCSVITLPCQSDDCSRLCFPGWAVSDMPLLLKFVL
jgi:murein DD-endopeptidase MepM/ murein hydrolase activator NlpD